MEVFEFARRWSDWYPSSPPYRPWLRRQYPERWLRIHSLPDGQRLALSDVDVGTMLQKQNRVASQLLGEGSDVAIVLTYGNGYRGQHEHEPILSLSARIIEGWHGGWTNEPAIVEDMEEAVFAVAKTTWRRGAFDGVIQAVGRDQAAPLLFVGLDRGCVYSPYDGGADLFVESETHLAQIRHALDDLVPKERWQF